MGDPIPVRRVRDDIDGVPTAEDTTRELMRSAAGQLERGAMIGYGVVLAGAALCVAVLLLARALAEVAGADWTPRR